ncbi:MAG: hypothetical protein NTU88_01970 [Armatimonadetes bacterium]|nr:hypothetical protein [Armatimonadota bacterium]
MAAWGALARHHGSHSLVCLRIVLDQHAGINPVSAQELLFLIPEDLAAGFVNHCNAAFGIEGGDHDAGHGQVLLGLIALAAEGVFHPFPLIHFIRECDLLSKKLADESGNVAEFRTVVLKLLHERRILGRQAGGDGAQRAGDPPHQGP